MSDVIFQKDSRVSLLAMFAFNTEDHVLLAHLTHLRQPGLGGKPLRGNSENNIFTSFNKSRQSRPSVQNGLKFIPVCDFKTDALPQSYGRVSVCCNVI